MRPVDGDLIRPRERHLNSAHERANGLWRRGANISENLSSRVFPPLRVSRVCVVFRLIIRFLFPPLALGVCIQSHLTQIFRHFSCGSPALLDFYYIEEKPLFPMMIGIREPRRRFADT